MINFITNREKDYNFFKFISHFGGCCSLKGFEYYHNFSVRHAKRQIALYLSLNLMDTIKFSDNEELRTRGIGNIYYPKRSISQLFNVNRKVSKDPEKLILKNLRFLTAIYLIRKNISPISFYEKEKYYKKITVSEKKEFDNYILKSNMEDLITDDSICVCLPTIWSTNKCINTILFWINIINSYKLKLNINIFSISNTFNFKIKNAIKNKNENIYFHEIAIDNFERNYTNFLISRESDLQNNELINF